MPLTNARVEHQKLVDTINKARLEYFTNHQSVITDDEYDAIYKELLALEQRYPELVTTESPSQHVGFPIPPEFSNLAVKHPTKMLGLENAFSLEDVKHWARKHPAGTQYRVELKYDGLACNLVYRYKKYPKRDWYPMAHNLLYTGTRGDGETGVDITLKLASLSQAKYHYQWNYFHGVTSTVEIRGELYMPPSNLTKCFTEQGAIYNNCRNAASAIVNSLNPGSRMNQLRFVGYEVLVDGKPNKELLCHLETIEWFDVSPTLLKVDNIDELSNVLQLPPENWAKYDCPIDGLVIKALTNGQPAEFGYTSRYPKSSIAFKFQSAYATTGISGVNWQIGRTGRFSPVLLLNPPITLDNTTVSNVTLHNWKRFKQYNLQEDSVVTVERRAMVSPQISHHFPGVGNMLEAPSKCPFCKNVELVIDNETHLMCPNTNCKGRLIEEFSYWIKSDILNIYRYNKTKLTALIEKDPNPTYLGIMRQLFWQAGEEFFTDGGVRFLVGMNIPEIKHAQAKILAELDVDFEVRPIATDRLPERVVKSLNKWIDSNYRLFIDALVIYDQSVRSHHPNLINFELETKYTNPDRVTAQADLVFSRYKGLSDG